MNRFAIFAHYDRDNLVDQYVWYLLNSLKEAANFSLFVTTSEISSKDIADLKRICSTVIIRQNTGYDFASWKSGIQSIENIDDFDELILCNDSVYGPFYPLAPIFDAMSQRECDFWGMTDSYEIAYHLQSYFLVFKKKVIVSTAFKEFWESVHDEETKTEVIKRYEVGLTKHLLSAGFKATAYAPYSFSTLAVLRAKALWVLRHPSLALKALTTTGSRNVYTGYTTANPTHFFWKELIVKYKMPFLKVELLRDNPLGINISDWEEVIRSCSAYDVGLIKEHLNRVKSR